jgi:subtilisin
MGGAETSALDASHRRVEDLSPSVRAGRCGDTKSVEGDMAKKNPARSNKTQATNGRASSSVDDLLLAALQRGDDSLETGRYLVTFKESAAEEGVQTFGARGMRVADARDFTDQAATLEDVGDADAVVFPEIGVALVGADAAQERSIHANAEIATDSPIEAMEPEYFVFPQQDPTTLLRDAVARRGQADVGEQIRGALPRPAVDPGEYLRGFARAAQAIAGDLAELDRAELEAEEDPLVVGATWGLIKCKVPPSLRSGVGIRVAVLDTGMDLGHPDFAGRPIVGATFVGQPVQDLHSHGTHCIGTSCGPKSPPGNTPRYGIAHRAPIFAGKVLTNSGTGATGGVLAGINWAIANRCVVISMSLGSQSPVQTAYTAAGSAALSKGCLIVAAAGNAASNTGSPANSPTIMSVASLDANLAPSAFSNFGKIEIAAPGRDVFSSVPRPTRYGIKSGTSMATPHVAGCAALWAETSPTLRGLLLWRKLLATARHLPFPAARVGAGLVQAP